MANRRMFSLKIIDTDLFLDMPQSARLLYYDLSMRADDDGFVASPKKIQRMIGCSDDDLKILIAKQFIIPFESGICVIKHWRIHNYIRSDRYAETLYKEEMQALTENNGTYELNSKPNVIPTVNQMSYQRDTQVRLGKDKLGKVSMNNTLSAEQTPYKQIQDLFNGICCTLPKIKEIKNARQKAVSSRWKENNNIQYFENLFNLVNESDFLSGRDGKWNNCCFDWILKPANIQKILEGNYKNQKGGSNGGNTINNQQTSKFAHIKIKPPTITDEERREIENADVF